MVCFARVVARDDIGVFFNPLVASNVAAAAKCLLEPIVKARC